MRFLIPKTLLATAVVLAAVLVDDAQAATCADFPNQAAAQRAANTRDADGDGVYCESLPCPCLKPGQGSPPPTSSPPPRRKPTTFAGRCVRGPKPDRSCTPGAVYANVTVQQICTPGYTARVRNVTSTTRRRIMLAYGIRSAPRGYYEVDHLVSLELGGSNSPRNLWPQSEHGYGLYSALSKDRVENRLHRELCAGQITLRQAQARIKVWWLRL